MHCENVLSLYLFQKKKKKTANFTSSSLLITACVFPCVYTVSAYWLEHYVVNIQAQRTNYKYTLYHIYIRKNVHVLLKILNTKKKNIIYDSIPFARVFFLPFKILPRKQRIRNIGNHASFHIRRYSIITRLVSLS